MNLDESPNNTMDININKNETTNIDNSSSFFSNFNEDGYDEYDEENNLESEIDNSNLSFSGHNICIRLNSNEEKNQRLKKSWVILEKKYPKLKKLSSENRMQYILEGVFPEGFQKQMYIRNLTFTNKNGYDIKILAIRPKRTPGDFMKDYLPEDVSLLFKGHIAGKEFVVDSIFEVIDTERLDFEVDVVATPYRTPERIVANFLFDILGEAASLTEYTEKKLEEWKKYLDWKKELASRQIYGCKYFKVDFDKEKKRLNFWLIFENKDIFKALKKYLSRDMQVFDNNYSKDRWHFDFIGDTNNKNQRFNSIELGRYRGVVSEYYLRDNSIDFEVEQEEKYFLPEEEWTDNDYDGDNDGSNTKTSVRSIYDVFKNPYIVQVAYDLNRRDADEINQRNLDDDEIEQYVYDNILGNYFSDGFLALSAIGDFVLIKRFQQAISQLERDESYSPNLAMWLFNVTHARTVEDTGREIDKWFNPKIEKNENQKEAVRKMLTVPDLCLVQGPPGTGKTTVIAEAIYQFVRRGDRVLVASQSNDAVDNALERLADSPEIRAIRLGQKGKRRRKVEDLSIRKFVEDEALKYYYNALSLQISKNWLDVWDSLERDNEQYTIDIRDAKFFTDDIATFNTDLSNLNQQYIKANKELGELKKKIESVYDRNSKIEEDKYQYHLAVGCFKGEFDSQFYLSEDMLRIFEEKLNNLIESTIKEGIYLTPRTLDLNVMGLGNEQNYVYMISKTLKILNELYKKIRNTKGKENSNDGKILILENKLTEIKDKIVECVEKDDTEALEQYKKEMNSLKKERDKLKFSSSIVIISELERGILEKNIISDIESGNADKWINKFQDIIEKWQQTIDVILNSIKTLVESFEKVNVSGFLKEKDTIESSIVDIDNKREDIRAQIKSKKQTLVKLQKKYEIENDDIIKHIEFLKEKNIKQLDEQKGFRDEWEKTIRDFKKRLEDDSAFKYDQEYYQQIYVNACNVVGISCTDNMRNLSDNGYNDFDVVIIDEVSKATPPELLIPLMKARKAILVGDHRQLPPMFKEHEGSYKELSENQEEVPEEIKDLLTTENFKRFQKMVTSSLFKDYFEKADESIKHSLLTQYRMHRDIMDIINRFYEQRLLCGNSKEEEQKEKNHNLTIKGVDGSTFVTPDRHAYWIDSSYTPGNKAIYEVRPNNSTSNYNVLEKYIIIELLKKIADAYKVQGYNKNNPKTVGVISFYQMQVNEIREAFREVKRNYDFSSINVDINTVDRFQGKEKNIIITSLVRNNHKGKASKHVVAFERINVAFSRAQELLFIVGAKHMYENQAVQLPNMDMPGVKTVPVYKNIMEELNRKGCFKSSNKIITPEIEEKIILEYKEMGGKL